MATILTDQSDFDAVISMLGVTVNDFSYADIESTGFLEAAEATVTKALAAQSGYGTTVPNITQILAVATPAVAADKVFLMSAVIYRIAFLYGPGETNSVDTAQSIGPVSKDLGGVGAQWEPQMDRYEALADQAIGSITGFKRWRSL